MVQESQELEALKVLQRAHESLSLLEFVSGFLAVKMGVPGCIYPGGSTLHMTIVSVFIITF